MPMREGKFTIPLSRSMNCGVASDGEEREKEGTRVNNSLLSLLGNRGHKKKRCFAACKTELVLSLLFLLRVIISSSTNQT